MNKAFQNIADLRAANAAAGMHFFDRATMKCWKSRIESTLIRGEYFITSEAEFAFDGRTPKRIYCVRRARPDASIETVASHLYSKESAKDHIALEIAKSHLEGAK